MGGCLVYFYSSSIYIFDAYVNRMVSPFILQFLLEEYDAVAIWCDTCRSIGSLWCWIALIIWVTEHNYCQTFWEWFLCNLFWEYCKPEWRYLRFFGSLLLWMRVRSQKWLSKFDSFMLHYWLEIWKKNCNQLYYCTGCIGPCLRHTQNFFNYWSFGQILLHCRLLRHALKLDQYLIIFFSTYKHSVLTYI